MLDIFWTRHWTTSRVWICQIWTGVHNRTSYLKRHTGQFPSPDTVHRTNTTRRHDWRTMCFCTANKFEPKKCCKCESAILKNSDECTFSWLQRCMAIVGLVHPGLHRHQLPLLMLPLEPAFQQAGWVWVCPGQWLLQQCREPRLCSHALGMVHRVSQKASTVSDFPTACGQVYRLHPSSSHVNRG